VYNSALSSGRSYAINALIIGINIMVIMLILYFYWSCNLSSLHITWNYKWSDTVILCIYGWWMEWYGSWVAQSHLFKCLNLQTALACWSIYLSHLPTRDGFAQTAWSAVHIYMHRDILRAFCGGIPCSVLCHGMVVIVTWHQGFLWAGCCSCALKR